ncbi:MAG: hypothetical protein JW818_12645 [Pirellulales bacterium]|nr:hypothetical protein [Pirellulales bacterium]
MPRSLRPSELEAYLDEALPPEDMARVERALRGNPAYVEQLVTINSRRDAGVHSLGEIWRRHRLSCPTREQLGSYLLGVLPDDTAEYVEFHLHKVGCRVCRANLADLETRQAEAPEAVETRRRRYFQSSAGYLGAKR